MNFTQVMTIARREYLARVRNKAFIFTTLLVPAMIGLQFGVSALLSRSSIDELNVAILDVGTGRAEVLTERLASIDDFAVTVSERTQVTLESLDAVREEFSQRVLDEDIDGYLVIENTEDLGLTGRYFARDTNNPLVLSEIRSSIRETALADYLADSSADLERIRSLMRSAMPATTVTEQGDQEGGPRRALIYTMVFSMLMYITVLIGDQQMGISIVEEKASRLIEVVLGAVTATEFMFGKIIGVLGSGVTQLAIWVGTALIALLYVLPAMAIGAAAMDIDLTDLLDPARLTYFAIFFVLGYLFYSVLFAVAGSICTTTEEFGHVAFPAMLPIIIALMISFYAATNPEATAARIASLFPPFTPLVMLARINSLRPPFWEILLSIVLLVAGIALSVWAAAKIFRFALLMVGKKPDYATIFRLMRAA